MNIPTNQQIDQVINLMTTSLQSVVENDSNIFNLELIDPPHISADARVLNRELHETTINHRLAYYIEKNLSDDLTSYNVDIEYNRYYNNAKEVMTIDGLVTIRPDIIIHARTDDRVQPQHYLVIEAKKHEISRRDVNKVKGLISDENYFYLFGMTVSYCSNPDVIIAVLYFSNGNAIESRALEIDKN